MKSKWGYTHFIIVVSNRGYVCSRALKGHTASKALAEAWEEIYQELHNTCEQISFGIMNSVRAS